MVMKGMIMNTKKIMGCALLAILFFTIGYSETGSVLGGFGAVAFCSLLCGGMMLIIGD